MMPITEEVHAFLTANAAAQIQRDDEYLDPADGLLHCKTCHGLRQTVIPAPGGTGFLRPRCLCPCQSAAEKQRKAAEEKRERLERIQRRKAHGLQDRRLYDCTFANDNGKTPGLTAKAKRYVEHWEDAARKNIGLLLFGDVGTGKSFLAGCIANALLGSMISSTTYPTIRPPRMHTREASSVWKPSLRMRDSRSFFTAPSPPSLHRPCTGPALPRWSSWGQARPRSHPRT